jgi:hypothetical protein
MQLGTRIVFDQDGEIVAFLGEMLGNVPLRKEITKLDYIDLEYASIDQTIHRIVKINPETKLPVLERIHAELTPEERIKELEDQILLMANENTGGIL